VLGELTRFRREFYAALTARSDVLFELTDAVLCADGPVRTLVDLTLVAEHRRGHGAMYGALNRGRLEPDRFRGTLASLPLPRAADGRIVLAVDVSPWLRSDAPTSAERLFCHVHGRARNQAQLIPGWPYSFVAALEPGRTSWTALLDAVRLGPTDDATAVTAHQLRAVLARLIAAGQWRSGDPDVLIVMDAGYDVTRLAFQATPTARCHRPPAQARTGVRPGQARDLARAGAHHDHRHHPLRHRDRHQLGPAASPAHPPRLLARPRRRAARHRGHPHPAAGRAPAR
jgi:hypothetical protein